MAEACKMVSRRAFGRGVLVVAGLLLAAGCGGEESPTAPSATDATLSVTYAARGTIFIGNQVQLEATVTLGDGSTQPAVNATWSSDAPSVATVSSAGVVTAVAAGEATISAEANPGGRGSLRIRVYPEFRGSWTGWWRMADCTASGAALWVQLCALLKSSSQGVAGSELRIDLTQDGGLVDGTVDLGELAVGDARPAEPFEVASGEVSIDGTLRLMLTTVTIAAQELELRAEVLSWETRADMPGRMTGQFQVELSVAGDSVLGEMTGALVLDGSLEEVMRSASAASAAPGTGGGVNWNGTAYDPKLGYIFVNSKDQPIGGWMTKNELYPSDTDDQVAFVREAGPPFEAPIFDANGERLGALPCFKPPWARLVAVEARHGRNRVGGAAGHRRAPARGQAARRQPQRRRPPSSPREALCSSAPPVDRRFRAFDARTGEELWSVAFDYAHSATL